MVLVYSKDKHAELIGLAVIRKINYIVTKVKVVSKINYVASVKTHRIIMHNDISEIIYYVQLCMF